MDGDCTHNPEDWNNKSIKLKCWEAFRAPRITDKTALIIKVSKGAKIRNRYNQVPHLTQDTRQRGYPGTGIVDRDFTHNPEDWNNKSIKLKCGETF